MHHSFTAIAVASPAELCLAESAEMLSSICHCLEMPALLVSADQSLRGINHAPEEGQGSSLRSRIKEKEEKGDMRCKK